MTKSMGWGKWLRTGLWLTLTGGLYALYCLWDLRLHAADAAELIWLHALTLVLTELTLLRLSRKIWLPELYLPVLVFLMAMKSCMDASPFPDSSILDQAFLLAEPVVWAAWLQTALHLLFSIAERRLTWRRVCISAGLTAWTTLFFLGLWYGGVVLAAASIFGSRITGHVIWYGVISLLGLALTVWLIAAGHRHMRERV